MPRNLITGEELDEQILTSGDAAAPRLNAGREAGVDARVRASMPLTASGRVKVLEQKFGAGNVSTSTDGEIFIFDPSANEFYPLDRSGGSMAGDVADLGGDALSAVGAGVGGVTPLTAGAGAMAAGGAREAATAALGGGPETGAEVAERGAAIGRETALGAGGQAVVGGLATVAKAFLPKRIMAKILRKASDSPSRARAMRESQAVERSTGLSLTPGQRLQSPSLLTLEGMLRRNPASADIILKKDEEQLVTMAAGLEEMLGKISRGKSSATNDQVGERITKRFTEVVKKARDNRRGQAAVDFAAVGEATGGARIMPLGNVVRTIDELVADWDVPGAGDAAADAVRKLRGLQRQLVRTDKKGVRTGLNALTGKNVQRLLSIYGRVAKGKGALFKDMDKADQRLIAGRMSDALMNDVDATIQRGGQSSEAMQALIKARSNYRENSAAIDILGQSTLGKWLGTPGQVDAEGLMARVAKMPPQRYRRTVEMIDEMDPELGREVRRRTVQDAIDRSTPSVEMIERMARSGQEVAIDSFSPARLLAELRKSPVWPSLGKRERFNMLQITKGLQRLSNRAGTEGSPTTPLAQAQGIAEAVAGIMVAGLDVAVIGRLMSRILAPRRLAQTLVDAPSQAQWVAFLRETERTTAGNPQRIMTALTHLAGQPLIQGTENTRPDERLDRALATTTEQR